MSLVDFDDDASFHSVSAPNASFNGHASIDDPFGFDVFGTGSSGTKTTTVTETVFSGSNDKLFDDFDPLATFEDFSNKHGVTHTTRVVTTSTASSDTQPKHDQFDPFGDFASNGSGDPNQAISFESTKQSWVDDDFETSNRKDVPSRDLDDSGTSQKEEVSDEKTGDVVPESTINSSNPFSTSEATNLGLTATEQNVPASPHSDGVFPNSNADAIDETLGDLDEETAPQAEMEDLSPVKLTESMTSPNKAESSLDSQFNFDGSSENWKSAKVEVVKPEMEATTEVETSSFDIVAFNNLKNSSTVLEDAKNLEIGGIQGDFPTGFEAAEIKAHTDDFDKSNAEATSDTFLAGNSIPIEGSQGDFKAQDDLNVNAAGNDPFLAGNSIIGESSLGDFKLQDDFDFNAADSNPFLAEKPVPREGSLGDFSTQDDFDVSTAGNDHFLAENPVLGENSLGDFNMQDDLDFNAADSDPILAENSIPREGSPSIQNDFEERDIFRQVADKVRTDESVSVLDRNVSKETTTSEENTVHLGSDMKVSVHTFSYQPEIGFRPEKKEQKPPAVPETVYNKMYHYKQDNSWRQKDMDDEDVGPVQFQLNDRRIEERESKEEVEEESSRSDPFFNDIKDRSRGRINIEEIRQRSYEDVGPMSSSQNRKEQKPADKSPVIYVLGAAADNVCKVCAKRVYEMEKVTADLQVYHKTCFRCHHCNRILSLGNFSANEGHLYCKPHFIEIFKTKGNYKDSFALAEQQKQRGDDVRGDDSYSQDQDDQGYRRSAYDDKDAQRNRKPSAGYPDEDERDDYDDDGWKETNLKEEIPVVPIKSVRSIFEKMSHDAPQPAQQQKKPTTKAYGAVHAEPTGRPNQEVTAQRIRNDSERSDQERARSRSAERRDSTSDREIVQSSTTCIVEDELPPPAFTRSLLAKFKMMEDSHGTGSRAPVVYGAPAPRQTMQATQRHQTLSYRSSGDSRASNDPVAEEICVDRDAPDSVARSTSQDRKEGDRSDELPQAGLAKSLLAQWRNLEEQSKRGRSREPRTSSSNARRSQSMSRVETVQRARMYPVTTSTRSKQEEDIRPDAYSDQEASGDDLPASIPTKQRLAKFRELEVGSRYGSESSAKPKKVDRDEKMFKWEVKESLPMNRGVLIVHGDVPRKPSAEEAAAASASAARWSDIPSEIIGPEHLDRRSATDDDDDGSDAHRQVLDDVVHGTTTTVIIEDELPPPATTRTLLQHFKSLEDVTKAPPRPRMAPAQANREPTSKMKPAAVYADDEEHEYEHTHQSPMNGDENDYVQYVTSPDSGEFGNDPVHDPSLVRESDRCDEEELPAQGMTKSLLAKFQSLQGKR